MKRVGDSYELSTGRRISANRGLLSLSPDKGDRDETRLYEGYDGHIAEGAEMQPRDLEEWLADDPILTADERREIAEFMIELWAEWGDVDPHQM
jgi:hypothetical protein